MDQEKNLTIKVMSGLAAAPVVDAFFAAHGSTAFAREIDTFFIAASELEIMGAVRFCVENDIPMLRSMRIHTDFRRQKISLKLLLAFQNYLNQNQVRKTYCIPYTHLESFYGRIGFKKIPENQTPLFIQERMIQYREKRQDVICMLRV